MAIDAREWIQQWILTNWPIKLTALALSAVLWAAVAANAPPVGPESTTRLLPVTLRIEAPSGRSLERDPPPVQALVSGSEGELIKLYEHPPVIHKTVPDTFRGSRYTLELAPVDLVLERNADVKIQEVQPRVITVELDDAVRRTVPVAPRVVILPDSGYALAGAVSVRPSSVVVRGPEAGVARIESVPTVPLELTGVTGPVRRTVPLDTAALGTARAVPAHVEIRVDVGPLSERVLMGVPVVVEADRRGPWASDPLAVTVTVRGPSRRLARLTRDSVQVRAVISGATGEETARLEVRPPEGLTAWPTPSTATVRRRARG